MIGRNSKLRYQTDHSFWWACGEQTPDSMELRWPTGAAAKHCTDVKKQVDNSELIRKYCLISWLDMKSAAFHGTWWSEIGRSEANSSRSIELVRRWRRHLRLFYELMSGSSTTFNLLDKVDYIGRSFYLRFSLTFESALRHCLIAVYLIAHGTCPFPLLVQFSRVSVFEALWPLGTNLL